MSLLSRLGNKPFFQNFNFFYSLTGISMLWVFVLSLITGVLDAVGLALIVPLIEIADAATSVDREKLGKAEYLLDFFDKLNVELNIISVVILLVAIFLVKGLFVYLSYYQRAAVRKKLIKNIRYILINGLNQYSYKQFIEMNIGQMNASFTTEVGQTSSAFQRYLKAIYLFMMVLTYLSISIFLNSKITFLILIIIPPIALVFNLLNKKTKRLSTDVKDKARQFIQSLLQVIIFFKYLKATAVFADHSKTLKKEVDGIEQLQYRIALLTGWVNTVKEVFIILIIVSLILLQVLVYEEPVAAMIPILILLYRTFNVFIQFQNSWQSYMAVSGSLEGVRETIKLMGTGAEKQGGEVFEGELQELSCENLKFVYGKTQIINNVSLSVKKNESVAFVGESGSGKTTIANILAGLLNPNSGVIKLNGKNRTTYDIDSYRQHIGYITQEPVVFASSIYENITLTDNRDTETVKRFWEACHDAHIGHYIQGLDEQENTPVGDFGVTLSGGQKQRLSIARELFRQPQLLVMDEATSALDSETEEIIQQNINELKGKTTLILIAHRLSTIKDVDCIYLINEGEIADSGSFRYLASRNKRFQQMLQKQGLV